MVSRNSSVSGTRRKLKHHAAEAGIDISQLLGELNDLTRFKAKLVNALPQNIAVVVSLTHQDKRILASKHGVPITERPLRTNIASGIKLGNRVDAECIRRAR